MKFKELNSKSIQAAFWQYHNRNPQVYDLFKKLAFQAISAGKDKLSSKMIINVIRWEHYVSVDKAGDSYKINDAFTPYYARLFMRDFPEHRGKFQTRQLRST